MSEDPSPSALREEHPLEIAEGEVSLVLFGLVQLKTRGELTDEAIATARAKAQQISAPWPSALEAFEFGVERLLRS